MRKLHNLLTQHLGLSFSQSLDSPHGSHGRSRLELLTEQYDACLGAVVGLCCATGNPYVWIVGNELQGELLLLVDMWLKKRLEEHGVSVKRPSLY